MLAYACFSWAAVLIAVGLVVAAFDHRSTSDMFVVGGLLLGTLAYVVRRVLLLLERSAWQTDWKRKAK